MSLHVDAHEIVGLIGTNGAGKSSLMNAIGGFVPSSGRIEVLGRDVSGLAPYRRARLGLGRGFQAARLYDDLTVRETVLVALEARDRTRVVSSMFALPPSTSRRAGEARVRRTRSCATSGSTASPTSSCRTSRPARAGSPSSRASSRSARGSCCSTSRPPASRNARPRRSARSSAAIRDELDAAVLLIEHDMALVMEVSDRVYCLEAGNVIAEGSPERVRHDPLVVASYLGTDIRSIQRSGKSS